MDILLTFIGNNDCLLPEKSGPIIGILENRSFDKVYLLYNHEKYLASASRILQYVNKKYPSTILNYAAALSSNPIDYNIVYPSMFAAVKEIYDSNKNASFTVSITSGTPTMHSCWIMLIKGGVIPAQIIQISRERGLEQVNFSLDDFPAIENVRTIKARLTSLSRENRVLQIKLGLPFEKIIGESDEILHIKQQIRILADTDIAVHIYGETGTGKELVAEALHSLSSRAEKSFIPVNCAAIPSTLFESEFFGYKRGAFTGARFDKKGFFQQADGGTLFLDEVCELPIDMQAKLLRVLQEGWYHPVGSEHMVHSEFRIISASNRDLKQMVAQSSFREDLYYRIVASEITIPALNQRGQDKILLANAILLELNSRHGTKKSFSVATIDKIINFEWPGNVRQLRHSIEAAFAYPSETIEPQQLQTINLKNSHHEIEIPDTGISLEKEVLPAYYEAALQKTHGNAERAAHLLGLEPHTFRARLRNLKNQY